MSPETLKQLNVTDESVERAAQILEDIVHFDLINARDAESARAIIAMRIDSAVRSADVAARIDETQKRLAP